MMKNKDVIQVKKLDFNIDTLNILSQVSLSVSKNEFVGLVGPNGSGKSTLLKNIYRHYTPSSGMIYLNGKDVFKMKSKEVAQQMAIVAQENQPDFDFSVREMVIMGRYSRKKMFEQDDQIDFEVVSQALSMVGMQGTEERSFLSLSGGEKQRIYLAMAFAQESELIILDEPTNHLDIGYQLYIMEIMRQFQDKTIFTSVHDMNLAARYCDRIIMLKDGRIIANGSPEEVLTVERIREVFHVDTEIEKKKGYLRITYLGWI
ncbi:MAG: ABC transporter ATP-binding protein [Blautia sp.]|nr:ABC transporter ATP-binding protein [Blautia sp.]